MKGVFIMKIKDNYVLTKVVDSYIAVPVGSGNVDLNTIISLNETGAFIWNLMKEDIEKEAVIEAMLNEYDVSREQAEADVDKFIFQVKEADLLK